ncbi:imidazole glycerol phosphate synthase subunit HisH [Ferrovibrio sp.]|uniref:imidazole glycerol phosphate synthase subunit HisH n=1 Tax=Ferrovibrio sp. TaxID=1917215 RepID=UPI0026062BD4|nr:imidazole glycerol phosphate synthase subunit HisH [Ferrovibrio sp.]
MTTVAIVDFGMGNIVSVAAAVEKLGCRSVVTSTPSEIAAADRIILPGVGAFGDAMRNLHERGLVPALRHLVEKEHKPILGICLGAQLICNESEEFGRHEGFGWIDAMVTRLDSKPGCRIPHVGWNGFSRRRDSCLLRGIPEDALFYYVHSFGIQCQSEQSLIADCEYGTRFAAIIESGNVFGTQFHPEKSQRYGLAVLNNFLNEDLVC